MAFVIRNVGKRSGSVKIKDKWQIMLPGESFTLSEPPVFHSNEIKVTKISDVPVKNKGKGTDGDGNTQEGIKVNG